MRNNIYSQPGLLDFLQGRQEFYSRRQKEKLQRDLLRAQTEQYQARAEQMREPSYMQRQLPSAIQEYEYYSQLTPDEQDVYRSVKRATPEEALYRRGVTIDPTGRAAPIRGFGEALGDIGAAQLQAQQDVRAVTEPRIRGEIVRQETTQKTAQQRSAGKTKARNALLGFERDVKRNVRSIDRALDLISPWSAGYGSLLSFMPESDAGKLQNLLTEIKARVGFDNLQRMRDNSPTGGALGQVSEMENRLLQAVEGTLDPAQSDQLRENLLIIRELYPEVLAEKRSAFNTDYRSVRRPGEAAAPAQAPVTEGVMSYEEFLR